jgi:hypothetical protein
MRHSTGEEDWTSEFGGGGAAPLALPSFHSDASIDVGVGGNTSSRPVSNRSSSNVKPPTLVGIFVEGKFLKPPSPGPHALASKDDDVYTMNVSKEGERRTLSGYPAFIEPHAHKWIPPQAFLIASPKIPPHSL